MLTIPAFESTLNSSIVSYAYFYAAIFLENTAQLSLICASMVCMQTMSQVLI